MLTSLLDAVPIIVSSSIFGHGTGDIFLDNMGCRGNETNLVDCPHNGVGVHNCFYGQDAGVICSQRGECSFILFQALPYAVSNHYIVSTICGMF